MRTRTTTALLTAGILALTGCSSSSEDDAEPKATATVTATQTPTISAEAARVACVDAWAEVISSRPDGFDPETDDDVAPIECDDVTGASHTDMYMEGLRKSNEAGRDELAECLDDPACTDFSAP
ncbi:hypothetical protein [Streptomyces uncialis]|uniref:hypothetical protein n=1 Tax=Streptomyces uncialis TaxID=1048205 RepID=UPI003868D6DF|nr:hypothetical protein OG924_12535 [Streptomyces uncialis]